MAILIRGGMVVSPFRERMEKKDILIEKGIISKTYDPNTFNGSKDRLIEINAEGKLVVPGLVDMHVHLREPGYEYKETILTGSMAAVSGGFTKICCMPNTNPINDNSSVTEFIISQAKKANLLEVYPIASITVGQEGKRLTEFGDLKEAGAIGVSDDGRPLVNSELMRRALEYASYHSLTVISHCEDLYLSDNGHMHEGEISTKIGLRGIPSESEEIMVFRDVMLAKLTHCHIHIAHVSTKGSVEIIKRAKEEGIPVTAETAPHYFSLDHRAVIGYDTNAKVNPPLRSEEDRESIKKALKEDIIDVIATDHAPHSPLEKDLEFENAAFGMIGLQTALPLTLSLVHEGVLDIVQAIKKLSLNPSKIMGLDGGDIREGVRADITIIDPQIEYVFNKDMILSKSRNTPFLNKKMQGMAVITISGGRIVWEKGRINTDH